MATQKGRNWSSGDIVTAANLSSIERGVSAVAKEYTPTTWANGNTVTAAGLNNIEQGIVNAGGGSSDFSTAEVTFKNLPNRNPYSLLALYVDTEHNCINSADLYVSIEESVTIPLYKNKAVLPLGTLSGVDYSVMPTVEGNVTINMNEETLEITGEGAFTCAGVSRD